MTAEEAKKYLELVLDDNSNTYSDDFVDAVRMAIDAFNAFEERKEGWWNTSIMFDTKFYTCSECNYELALLQGINSPNFCPNCGARMTESEDTLHV